MTDYNDSQKNNSAAYFGTFGSTGVKFDKNNFRIEGGCTQNVDGTWTYRHTSHEYPGGIRIVFQSAGKPILGDQVVSGVLVPRPIVPNPARDVFQEGWPEPIINNDPGFQEKKMLRKQDRTWPDDKAWIDHGER